LFEFRAPRKGHPVEQIPSIQGQSLLFVSPRHSLSKRHRIAPYPFPIQGNLILSPTQDRLLAEGLAEEVERFSDSRSGPFRAQIRPEEVLKLVSATDLGVLQGEIGKEADALGLGEDGEHFAPFRPSKVERAQDPQLEHAGRCFFRVAHQPSSPFSTSKKF
jgi:hypothetical protein